MSEPNPAYKQRKIPRNSTESMTVAIVSMALAAIPHFGAIVGLIVAMVGAKTANKAIKRYDINPKIYANKKRATIAKILSVISIAVNAILVILLIVIAKSK